MVPSSPMSQRHKTPSSTLHSERHAFARRPQHLLYVKNQPHPSITQNCPAGDSMNTFQAFAQITDDDLLLTEQFIDHESVALARALNNHDNRRVNVAGLRRDSGKFRESDQRKNGSAHVDHFAA